MDASVVEGAKHPAVLRSLENRNLSRAERRALLHSTEAWLSELSGSASGDVSRDELLRTAKELIPTLAPAMAELLRAVEYNERMRRTDPTLRKIDPISWIASFLFRNNPRFAQGAPTTSYGRMLERAVKEDSR